ncbi:MAG: MbnP family protein [Salibacteraceae bacterium]
MKAINIFFAAILLVVSNSLIAQTSVSFSINHLLGSEAYSQNKTVTSPNGNDVNINRLEYYISQIELIHDGGQSTLLNEKYFLVNANSSFTGNLGSLNITSLEKIKFGVGVDNTPNTNPSDPSMNTTNHADPSLWSGLHPLAPKSPSMHWGWSAGYRFVAMEGKTGSSMNLTYEIHALGDANYFEVSIDAPITASNNAIEININADYLQSLTGIDVSSGLILHSETGLAVNYLKNFQTKVFSAALASSNEENDFHNYKISMSPNPSNGETSINFEEKANSIYEIIVQDLSGKEVSRIQEVRSQNLIQTTEFNSGIYIVTLLENGSSIYNEKLIVSPK